MEAVILQFVGRRNAFFSQPEDDGGIQVGSRQPSDQGGAWGRHGVDLGISKCVSG